MPTSIEWTDESWQVTHGCAVVSPGCTNCYAMRFAARLERMELPQYAGLTEPRKGGPVWTGVVREAEFGDVPQPLRWKKPRRIFVNSMSDLFHKDVSVGHIAHVFRIMRQASQHTFQVLTKRPDRAADMLNDPEFQRETAVIGIATEWPLPNVWLGTSVEDQIRADERIPHLLRTKAALHFLSVEPMLGPVDLRFIYQDETVTDAIEGMSETPVIDAGDRYVAINPRYTQHAKVGWVICGGESGPHARPMRPAWLRALRDQCAAASVPFFFKQWGEFVPDDPAPDAHTAMRHVGKKAAGALLDGRKHLEFPTPHVNRLLRGSQKPNNQQDHHT